MNKLIIFSFILFGISTIGLNSQWGCNNLYDTVKNKCNSKNDRICFACQHTSFCTQADHDLYCGTECLNLLSTTTQCFDYFTNQVLIFFSVMFGITAFFFLCIGTCNEHCV